MSDLKVYGLLLTFGKQFAIEPKVGMIFKSFTVSLRLAGLFAYSCYGYILHMIYPTGSIFPWNSSKWSEYYSGGGKHGNSNKRLANFILCR